MNVIIVNYANPGVSHISGVRAWQFASQLARAGHRVVLGTSPLPQGVSSMPDVSVHDWDKPMIVVAEDERSADLRLGAMRKVRTALQFAFGSGPEGAWARALEQSIRQLQLPFRPDLVIGVFGNMGALHAARRIARYFGCPWMVDVKDSFRLYVPRGMRLISARRLRSAAGAICNSELQRGLVRSWLGVDAKVVYSGVDTAFFARPSVLPSMDETIQLIGGIYSESHLRTFLEGVADWASRLPGDSAKRCRLRYLGTDGSKFAKVVASLRLPIRTEDAGYLPVGELAQMCRTAVLNAYIWHPGGFHHKLLELLVAGRPVVAIPGECGESLALASQVGGQLHLAACSREVARALELALEQRVFDNRVPSGNAEAYTWEAQSRVLEDALHEYAGKRRS